MKNILEKGTKIRWMSKGFDFFGDGNRVRKGDIGEICRPESKNQYLVEFIGSKDRTIRIYATIYNFKTLNPEI